MPDLPEAVPLWERRYRAPTRTLPVWSPHAPDRFALLSDEDGSFQAFAWRHGSEPRRLTDEKVGVSYATVSADGERVIWFSDPTGDESGRWLSVPMDGGEPAELLPGAPLGWPEGLAVGLERVVAVIAAQVTGPGGSLDGNGNGVGGDNYVLTGDPAVAPRLFRLFGDND